MRVVRRTPDLRVSTEKSPYFASLSFNPGLSTAVAPQIFYAADSENACVKRVDVCGTQNTLYTATGGLLVHAVLCLPTPTTTTFSDELCLVQSCDVSRQIGVLIRQETFFTIAKLEVYLSEGKWTSKVLWQSEFYRCDRQKFDPELFPVSLCRSGHSVLCDAPNSHRLTAFEYEVAKPLRRTGIQNFDAQIVDMAAVNAATGRRVAIAFRDNETSSTSIRLYRHWRDTFEARKIQRANIDSGLASHLSLHSNSKAVSRSSEESSETSGSSFSELQETFRVDFDNVHKLLWIGDRLLVAERPEDEERDVFWSCQFVKDGLVGECSVQAYTQPVLASWSSRGNWIVASYQNSSDVVTLKYVNSNIQCFILKDV